MDKRKEAIEKLQKNLLLFGKVISPHTFSLPSPAVHYSLAEVLLNKTAKYLNIIAPRGIAKALSLDSIVYTVDGAKTIADVRIGEKIYDRYGNIQTLTHKSDIFNKPMYKITLADSREIKVSEDHNNVILRKKERGNRNHGTREMFYEEIVATTKDIVNSGILQKRIVTKKQSTGREFKYWIPTCLPIEYSHKDIPLDPYLIGLLLGDGSIDKATGYSRLHCHIDDLPFYQKKLSRYDFGKINFDKRSNAIAIGILGIGSIVKQFIGTNNCYSKKIPKIFFTASKEQRIELLRGLMDTDGSISSKNISFVSVSKQLAYDVAEIVRSLGGIARITDSKTYYKVGIRININPFAITRKAVKFIPNAPDKIGIVSIERIDDCPSQCISVTGNSKTFLTDGYTITHNTTIVTIYVLYHLFLDPEPGKKFVVIISKTQAHSKTILSSIKEILAYSTGFRQLFGYQGEHSAKVWRDDAIVLGNGNGITTRGTGQPMRGINLGMQRPTLVIVDDPEDENNTKTKEAMDSNLMFILQSVTPSIDAKRGRVIVIGTPLHELCIVQRLSTMSSWKHVFFQNSIQKGLALWPESKNLEWLTQKRDELQEHGLVRSYYQEYECELIAGTDSMFKEEYIQYYDKDAYLEWQDRDAFLRFPSSNYIIPVNVYMGVDPASSIQQSADYSTIVPIAVDAQMNIYVLDYFRKRVNPMDLADSIENWYLRFKPNLTTIESVGYQEMLRQYMRTRIFIPGLEIKENPRQSKSARLEMLQPFFAQKKVFIKESIMKDLVEELIMFPKSKHEDLMDGLYYAVKRSRGAVHSKPEHERNVLPEHLQVIVEYMEADDDDALPTHYDPFED